ncbi:MAG: DUF167 domain-containing protein [Chloroflexota bacterium]
MTEAEIRFFVRLTPRGGVDRVDGAGEDGVLRVRVAAPPIDDAANRALVALLAAELGVRPSSVRIAAGFRSRRKTVAVADVRRAAILARWPGLGL